MYYSLKIKLKIVIIANFSDKTKQTVQELIKFIESHKIIPVNLAQPQMRRTQINGQDSCNKILESFKVYLKTCAVNFNQVQKYKRQLIENTKDINCFLQVFKQIDKGKNGCIFPKHLITYLISTKILVTSKNVDLFFHKHAKAKLYLDYEDFQTVLLPHNGLKTISYPLQSAQLNKLLLETCKNVRQSLMLLCGIILGCQINFIANDFQYFNKLQDQSLQKGAQLWRILDNQHCNRVDFQTIQSILNTQNSSKTTQSQWKRNQSLSKITKDQWQSFLYWHFEHQENFLIREKYQRILRLYYKQKMRSQQFQSAQLKHQIYETTIINRQKVKKHKITNTIRDKLCLIELKQVKYQKIISIVKKQLVQFSNIQRIIDERLLLADLSSTVNFKVPQKDQKRTKKGQNSIKKSSNLSEPKHFISSFQSNRNEIQLARRMSLSERQFSSSRRKLINLQNKRKLFGKSMQKMTPKTGFSRSNSTMTSRQITSRNGSKYLGYQNPQNLIKSVTLLNI